MGSNLLIDDDAGELQSGAAFSPCRRYRTRLWRIWDPRKKPLGFCGMNPSIADASIDDNTVRMMRRRALDWGYGGLIVVNAFSIIETDSRKLRALIEAGTDIVGADNDAAITVAAKECGMLICGWGKPGSLLARGDAVLKLIRAVDVAPYALKINKDGSPQHPLYIAMPARPVQL